MVNKAAEKRRSAHVRREFPKLIAALGFERQPSGAFTRLYGSHVAQVWLQKFTLQPFLFRVAMSFQADGAATAVVEFADKYAHRHPPGGRRYDFSFRFGDDSAERCVNEIRDFVTNVALPWFEEQALAAGNPGSDTIAS